MPSATRHSPPAPDRCGRLGRHSPIRSFPRPLRPLPLPTRRHPPLPRPPPLHPTPHRPPRRRPLPGRHPHHPKGKAGSGNSGFSPLTFLADVKAVGNLASTYARALPIILKAIRDPGQAIIVDDTAERAVVGRIITDAK